MSEYRVPYKKQCVTVKTWKFQRRDIFKTEVMDLRTRTRSNYLVGP